MKNFLRNLVGTWFSRNNENPNDPITDDDEGGLILNSYADAGVNVGPKHALTLSPFWQGVNLLGGDFAKIPLEYFKKKSDGTNEAQVSDPLYKLVHQQPNDDQHAYDFWEQMIVDALVFRNAYALIFRDPRSMVPTQLVPLMPDRTQAISDNRGRFYQTEINGQIKFFDPYYIFHLKGISLDGNSGLELWRYLKESIGLALARRKFQSRFFRFGGRVGGVLQVQDSGQSLRGQGGPGGGSGPKRQKDRTEREFREAYENPDAAFRTIALKGAARWHAAQHSFRDAQILEATAEDVFEAARWLCVPPHKLGAKNDSKHTHEQENRSYYDSSLAPWCRRTAAQCWLKLLSIDQRKNGTSIFEHKIQTIHWADSKTVAGIGSQGVRSGWVKPNEVRGWFNLPPAAGGDQLLIPSGMVPMNESKAAIQLSGAVQRLKDDTNKRFVKRLLTAGRRAAKTDDVNGFVESLRQSHVDVGREMFAPVQDLERSLGNENVGCHATELVESWAEKIEAARDAGEPFNEIIEQIGSVEK